MTTTAPATTAWLTNPNTPNDIIADVLTHHTVADLPLPNYLHQHLSALAQVQQPTDSQVDEARIPLTNWFRQQREAANGGQ